MTAQMILNMFEDYRKARIHFVQTVAELAVRPQNYDVLKNARVVELLKPLLADVCVQIQQCAAVALGRLGHHDAKISRYLVEDGTLNILLKDIRTRNKNYKKSAMFVLRSMCKHEAEMAAMVASSGGMEAAMICLMEQDTSVKESAAWAIGYMARHSRSLAHSVADAGAIPHLVLCLQEPALSVKRTAASALADIARHGYDLAQLVNDAGAVSILASCITNRDDKLKRQALAALMCIAQHHAMLAESVIQADAFPATLVNMGHACPEVRRNAAALVRDVVKHNADLSQYITNVGGVGALTEVLHGNEPPPVAAVTALGFIAGHGDQLASCVVACEGHTALTDLLCERKLDFEELEASIIWALGQIGRHCPDAVANDPRNFTSFIKICENNVSENLRSKCEASLLLCVQDCHNLSALLVILHSESCPSIVTKRVLFQITKILPHDPRARRLFVTNGSLKRIQEMDPEPGSDEMEYINMINVCFPPEIVRYYSPGYPETLLEKVEQYSPNFELLEGNEMNTPYPSMTNSHDIINAMH